MIIAGIDPGMTGAISIFSGGELLRIEDMPCFDGRVDGLEVSALIEGVDHAYIENQHPMPKNGSIASFKLGMNYGVTMGVIEQMSIPVTRIPASAWKRWNGLLAKNKDSSLALARELWPHMKPLLRLAKHHNRAEAALIGRYGVYRQIHNQTGDMQDEDRRDHHPAARRPGGADRRDHRTASDQGGSDRTDQGAGSRVIPLRSPAAGG